MSVPTWKWFIEYTTETQAHMHGISRYIYSGQTRFQTVEIVETEFFGRCLILDGKIQSAEKDEYIYHETLIHPAMVLHPNPERVMIIGGGEGAVIREILKHPSIKKVTMVDIDKEVVVLCDKYLPEWNDGAFQDPRVNLFFMDARKYLEETQETFDVIFSDLTEPLDDGPSYLLFTREFYEIVYKRLSPQGVMALQSGSFNINLIDCHTAICNTMSRVFPYVSSYAAFIPSYDAQWGFTLASKKIDPRGMTESRVDQILQGRNINGLKYYDGETHRHMFSITKDVRVAKDKENRIIEDDNPLFTF